MVGGGTDEICQISFFFSYPHNVSSKKFIPLQIHQKSFRTPTNHQYHKWGPHKYIDTKYLDIKYIDTKYKRCALSRHSYFVNVSFFSVFLICDKQKDTVYFCSRMSSEVRKVWFHLIYNRTTINLSIWLTMKKIVDEVFAKRSGKLTCGSLAGRTAAYLRGLKHTFWM